MTYNPDFILAKSKTPEELVSLLLERIPSVREKIRPADEMSVAEPWHTYERFAELIQESAADDDFLQAAGKFVSELTEIREPLAQDILVIGVLESIALGPDPELSTKISPYLSENARQLLQDVQRASRGT